MFKIIYISKLNHFLVSNIISILFFTSIYYYLFLDIDKHYLLNNNINKHDYMNHKFINSLFLSVNIQTATGFTNFYMKSSIAKIATMIQLVLAVIINLGIIYISFN